MENIECAEIISDLLAEKEKLNLSGNACEALNIVIKHEERRFQKGI